MEGANWKITEQEAGPSSSSGVAATQQQNPPETFHHHRKEAEYDDEEEETEEEEEEDVHHHKNTTFVPGPLLSLKDQIEKDKEDESLRRWKEKLLGCMESDLDGIGQIHPEVKFHSIGIISEDFGEVITPLPVDGSQNGHIQFTLKEGSHYQLKLKFCVLHNIVSGLTYCNTVWKGGLQVDQSKAMLGTFAPQKEPYIHALKEDITPSGVLARGVYSAKIKFEDDDRRCHMELKYTLEIKKR